MNRSLTIYGLIFFYGVFYSTLGMDIFGANSDDAVFNQQRSPSPQSIRQIPPDSTNQFQRADPSVEIQNIPSESLLKENLKNVNSNLKNVNSIEFVLYKQLEDLHNLDYSKAYYANMSADFKKTISLEVFNAFIRKNPTLFRNKDLNVESKSFIDIVATVKGKLTSTDDQTARVTYDLIQEDGEWKIRKIDIIPMYQPPQPVRKIFSPLQR